MTEKYIGIAAQAGLPVLITGEPGTGKSACISGLANALGWHCEILVASIREPADFGGLPVLTSDGVRLEPPAWAKRLANQERAILFLDEINTAPPAVQAALLRVVLDRTVGELELPNGISVVAACNPTEQAAGGWELAPPLANRFIHLRWQVDVEGWTTGMTAGWPEPDIPRLSDSWTAGIPAARALIASFIRRRPDLLLRLPQEESKRSGAWPSPRTWDIAARAIAACTAAGADDSPLIGGAVGDGVALEFISWRRSLDLPDPEDILANPAAWQIPQDRDDLVFATANAVAAAAIANLTPQRWQAAWEFLDRVAAAGRADLAVIPAKSLAREHSTKLPVPKLGRFTTLLKDAGIL